MMLIFAAGAALAVQPAEPARSVAPSDFDLSSAAAGSEREHPSELVPERLRNLDARPFPIDAAEAEWQVAADGPVLALGAGGGRRSGRPKLAHVALDWSF